MGRQDRSQQAHPSAPEVVPDLYTFTLVHEPRTRTLAREEPCCTELAAPPCCAIGVFSASALDAPPLPPPPPPPPVPRLADWI